MACNEGAAAIMSDVPTTKSQAPDDPTPAQLQALWLPMALFIIVSVADTVSSSYMLLSGIMEEYNPLMRWVWAEGGLPAFLGVKAFLTVVPVWLFNRLKTRRYGLVYRAVWLTLFGYAVIYGLLFCLANY